MVSNICCYDGKPFTINTTISSTMSEDGCAKAAIDCVEEAPGNAKTVLSVKNYCEDYATKVQLEEKKEMILESGCQEENVESKDDKEGNQLGSEAMEYLNPKNVSICRSQSTLDWTFSIFKWYF